jgi:hypothetical protein
MYPVTDQRNYHSPKYDSMTLKVHEEMRETDNVGGDRSQMSSGMHFNHDRLSEGDAGYIDPCDDIAAFDLTTPCP